jgi:hypothetical protein
VDVYFPPGNYVVSNLTMDFSTFSLQGASGPPYGYRAVRLMGASQRQVLLTQKSGATGAMLLIQGQVGTNAGLANNNKVTGAVVENIEFVGTSGAGNHAITLRSITNCLIRNVMISACGGSGIYMQRDTFTGSNDEYFYAVHVEDSRIVACSRYGIEASAQAAVSAALTNIDIEACTLGGILVNPALFSMRGCTVFGCGGPGLNCTPNAVALSANFVLSVAACRFEGNCQSSGIYEILIDGCPGYVLDGLAVLATAASGPHCLGLGTAGTGKVNHHGLIMGGYYTGNASTAGQKWIVTGSDDQNPIALSPRINFSGFAGGAVIPNSLITGGATLLYLDPANIRPAADGWIDWTRRISTPGSPSANGARMFNRASAVDGTKGQLVVKWPNGNVSTMAHELAPSDWAAAAPVSGAHVLGEIVWNSAPASAGFIGWVCTSAGTPGTWKTFGLIS